VQRLRTVEELTLVLGYFARYFHNHWIIGRIGYRTPVADRRIRLGESARILLTTCLRNCMRYTPFG